MLEFVAATTRRLESRPALLSPGEGLLPPLDALVYASAGIWLAAASAAMVEGMMPFSAAYLGWSWK